MKIKLDLILLLLCTGDKGYFGSGASSPTDPQHIYFPRSKDNGIASEDKHVITHFIYSVLCTECDDKRKNWKALFVLSGAGLQTREGLLAFALLVKDHENKERNYLPYSEDFGETWSAFIDFLVTNANEAKLVELNNGSLLLSI